MAVVLEFDDVLSIANLGIDKTVAMIGIVGENMKLAEVAREADARLRTALAQLEGAKA
jgi:hypothetical protein